MTSTVESERIKISRAPYYGLTYLGTTGVTHPRIRWRHGCRLVVALESVKIGNSKSLPSVIAFPPIRLCTEIVPETTPVMNEPQNPTDKSQPHSDPGVKDQPVAIAVVKDAASYIGLYPLGSLFGIAITEKDGALYGQHTNQMVRRLREVAPDRFAVEEARVPSEIVFERDVAGNVIALVSNQNGVERRGPRRDLPQWPKEVTLPIDVLREYVGSYPRAPGISFTVTEEDGKLFTQVICAPETQMPSQPKLQIFASAQDEFFSKLSDTQFSFERDTSGRVIGFVLHQRMRKLPEPTAGR